MAKPKRQISLFIETELWKEFSKKCIDKDKSKTEAIVELIKKFLRNNF